MREQRKIMTALALTMLAVLLLVVLAAAVEGAPAAERPADWTEHQVTAHNVAEQLRALGYRDDNPVIAACQEWWRSEKETPLSQPTADSSPQGASQDGYVSDAKRQAYPVAARVWTLLREAGLREACTAGIIGNMMSECGGQTLNLSPGTYSGGYYGLCMWSLYYFPEADGLGADAQVAKILATLGEGFYQATTVREAARWFSDNWERPAVWSEVRADNAQRALEYFGGADNG